MASRGQDRTPRMRPDANGLKMATDPAAEATP
jgi:hypothetical protein